MKVKPMTVKEYYELLQLAKDRKNWTSKLFEEYKRACIEMKPCIFNELRKILPEKEYEEFDFQYCSHKKMEGTKEDESKVKKKEEEY